MNGEPLTASRRPLLVLIIVIPVLAVVSGAGLFVLLQNKQALPAFIQPLVGGRSTRILGEAMAPTLRSGQVVSVDTQAYVHHPPQRGDIVLFTPPSSSSRLFIKRIIAIPGDRLLITNGVVSINGQTLSEPYLAEPWTVNNSWPSDGHEVILPANQYFVMGDNRNPSSDSRNFGFVNLETIQARVVP